MSLALACPRCQDRFEVADELAGQAVACRQCGHALEAPAKEKAAPPPRFRPRTPFPLRPILTLVIGLLFLLLVVSVGFNIWYVLGFSSEHRLRSQEQINAIEQKVQMQRMQDLRAAETARQQQVEAQREINSLKQQNQELKRQLEILKEQRTQDPE